MFDRLSEKCEKLKKLLILRGAGFHDVVNITRSKNKKSLCSEAIDLETELVSILNIFPEPLRTRLQRDILLPHSKMVDVGCKEYRQ